MKCSSIIQLFAALAIAPLTAAQGQLKPQTPTGSHIPVKPGSLPEDQTRRIIAEFARCAVAKHPNAAAHYLLGNAAKVEIKTLSDADCLPKETYENFAEFAMLMPPAVFSYALADALVNAEFPTFSVSQVQDAAALTPETVDLTKFTPKPGKNYKREELEKLEKDKADALAHAAFAVFGECVVHESPSAAHTLIRAQPTSPEEAAAIQSLMPALGRCLDQGENFQANQTSLRGIVALSYYRVAHAPRVQQQAAK
jgi:hypothetical protein